MKTGVCLFLAVSVISHASAIFVQPQSRLNRFPCNVHALVATRNDWQHEADPTVREWGHELKSVTDTAVWGAQRLRGGSVGRYFASFEALEHGNVKTLSAGDLLYDGIAAVSIFLVRQLV